MIPKAIPRKRLTDAEKLKVVAIRLNDRHRAAFAKKGGVAWLRRYLERN